MKHFYRYWLSTSNYQIKQLSLKLFIKIENNDTDNSILIINFEYERYDVMWNYNKIF